MFARRAFLAGASSLALATVAGAMGKPARRPNILLIIADDWGWVSSRAEDPFGIKMPTFDRIRRSGVHFENAFVAQPSCTPSRAAILTGRPPYQLKEGAYLSGTLRPEFQVYPDLFEAAGYHVGYCGKGWAPGNDTAGGRTRNPAGAEYPDFAAFLKSRAADTPFCFWFGSTNPHRPYQVGEGGGLGIQVPPGVMPPYLPDVPTSRRDVADYIARVQRFDSEAAAVIAALESAGELENTITVITGDNGWPYPRSKANLYDSGTHAPLAIMWPARIGPGRSSRALVSLIDLAPTFLEAARIDRPAEMVGKSLLAHLLGGAEGPNPFVVTSLERHNDGREISGFGYPARAIRTDKWLYIKNLAPDRSPAGKPNVYDPGHLADYSFAGYPDIDYGITKEFIIEHKDDPAVRPFYEIATSKRPAAQLFDVVNDPYNMKDLASDPQFRPVVRDLDKRLVDDLTRRKDPRIVGGGEFFDKVPPFVKHDPNSRHSRPLDF